MYRLTEFSLRRPWLTLAVLLVITGVLGAGLPKVKPAYGFRVLVGSDQPAIQALSSLVEQFSGSDPVRIAWECGAGQPCETVFDVASLGMADALTRELAVVTTSVTLALGFLALMTSAWQTLATFGFFLALSIMGAMVSTLFVLPELVFAFAPDSEGELDSAKRAPHAEGTPPVLSAAAQSR
ncbi:MAG: hypothetical protein HRU00_09150 [Myxococcales bacterium]|nr:hypothetical protein [Myxococcales bacterium]